jgi:fluoride ion exporter CrcB/FEX
VNLHTATTLGLVALGGGAGAAARYALSLALQRVSLTMPYHLRNRG